MLGIQKESLRKIKPRSYSKLLKSESEEEQEGTEGEKTFKINIVASSKQGSLWWLYLYLNMTKHCDCISDYFSFIYFMI